MRIVAGTLGGRIFASPSGHVTHPMSDKMRGALFNSLGDIEGLTVLDGFAGSGALGFEAISRGAASVLMIEKDRNAQRAIRENIASLGVGNQVKLVSAGIHSWLATSRDNFDIILLDPPYDKLQLAVLQAVVTRVRPDGQLVLSWPGAEATLQLPGCSLSRRKDYGDGSLCFYDVSSR